MSDFVERLPWRLAALAGLVVGVASLIAGTDAWVCLLRVGAACAIFGGLGLALRTLLQQEKPSEPPPKPPPPTEPAADETGSRVDQTTPEMTVDDL